MFRDKRNIKIKYFKFKNTAKVIGYLDAIVSLSVISEQNKFIRPIFNHDHIVDIKDGFHPVVSIVEVLNMLKMIV